MHDPHSNRPSAGANLAPCAPHTAPVRLLHCGPGGQAAQPVPGLGSAALRGASRGGGGRLRAGGRRLKQHRVGRQRVRGGQSGHQPLTQLHGSWRGNDVSELFDVGAHGCSLPPDHPAARPSPPTLSHHPSHKPCLRRQALQARTVQAYSTFGKPATHTHTHTRTHMVSLSRKHTHTHCCRAYC